MRIVFISTMAGHPWGGSEELWVQTADLALRQGHTILISVFDWGQLHPKLQNLQNNGATIHLRPRATTPPILKFHELFISKLEKNIFKKTQLPQSPFEVIKQFNPDVLCISQGYTFEAFFEQRTLVKFILTLQVPYFLVSQFGFETGTINYNAIEKILSFFNAAITIFFVSERNKIVAERQLASQLHHAKVIANPRKLKLNMSIPYPDSQVISFACVARLECNFKGQDILLQILSDEYWRTKTWKLNLYGDGPDKAYLQQLAIYYSIDNKVNFCGYVHDVSNIWANNHILLLPSIGEGTPLALIEAMACGRIAVVTDVGGNAEMVKDDDTGFIAEGASIGSFNKALLKAWNRQAEWCDMGLKAQAFVNAKIDIAPEKTLLKHLISIND